MRQTARALLFWCAVAAALISGPASALDPTRTIGQYKHTRWTIEDGAPSVSSLAQDRQGYLWIGGRDGLYRFDGTRFEPIAPQVRVVGRGTANTMLVDDSGAVWTGYVTGGLTVYRGGLLREVRTPAPETYVMNLVQTQDRTIWVALARPDLPLLRREQGRWQEIGANWDLPRGMVFDILAARDGDLWVTLKTTIAVLRKGTQRFERQNVGFAGHAALSEDPGGNIWISDDQGSRIVAPATGSVVTSGRSAYKTPNFLRAASALFDRDGNLWGWDGQTGLFRARRPNPDPGALERSLAAVELFRAKDGLNSDIVGEILEDREGNIWVGSSFGLERFRAAPVAIEPNLTKVGKWGFALLGASDGSVYVGQADSVYRALPRGRPEPLIEHVPPVEAICQGPDKTVWIALSDRILQVRDGTIRRIPRPPLAGAEIFDCAVDSHNALWVTTTGQGLFRRTGEAWEHLMVPPPGGSEFAWMIRDADGRLLTYFDSGRFSRLDYPNHSDVRLAPGSPLQATSTLYSAPDGPLIGGAYGLARMRGDKFQMLATKTEALRGIVGIAQSGEDTWMMGRAGIIGVSTRDLDKAFANPQSPLPATVLDVRDGLPGFYIRDGKRDAVRGGDGRLWFATTSGVVWVDPKRLSRNPQPPPVAIGALKAKGMTWRNPAKVTLPKGVSSGEIDFAVLSLAIPERVQVRYRLEGVDDGWIDPGPRRQMFFTNLSPGTYRFHVIGSNNDGVWNRQGATLEFMIPPTFLQSWPFMALCALGAATLLWAAYGVRMRQVQERAQAELGARLSERERIARELHDTLLQGFQGLVLRFQAVAERVPVGQPLRPIMDDALERADAVLIEGRDRVRELRTLTSSDDLAQVLVLLAEDLSVDQGVRFDLTVEGRPRALHPVVREEVQRIGEEAVRNAFVHAEATRIEATLTYRSAQLDLNVRDDGVGLPKQVATDGVRSGHYGLTGMRERAARIGGTLTILSREGSGAEVLFRIPGRRAYANRRGGWRTWLSPGGMKG